MFSTALSEEHCHVMLQPLADLLVEQEMLNSGFSVLLRRPDQPEAVLGWGTTRLRALQQAADRVQLHTPERILAGWC